MNKKENYAFCLQCGKQGAPLFEGLCAECYQKSLHELKIKNIPTITICTTCGALRLPSSGWTRPLKYEEIIMELQLIAQTFIDVPPTAMTNAELVEEIDFSEARPRAKFLVTVEDQPISQFPIIKQSAEVSIPMDKGICDTCSNIKNQVYKSTLQLRADRRKLTQKEEDMVVNIIQTIVREATREAHESYLLQIKEVRGGLDFFFSDRYIATLAAQAVLHKLGGSFKETFKLVGEEKDGTKKYKNTIVIRLPLLQVGDWIILNDQPHLVIKKDRLGIITREKGVGKAKRYEWGKVKEINPINSQIVSKDVLIVSKMSDSFLVMDNNNYETFEIRIKDLPIQAEEGMSVKLGYFEDHVFFMDFLKEETL